MRGVKKLIRAVSDEVGNARGGFYAAGLSGRLRWWLIDSEMDCAIEGVLKR